MAVTQVVLHGPSYGQGDPKVTPEKIADEVNVSLNELDAAVTGVLMAWGGVTKTDRSGVVTLGGQAQTVMAANAARKGWSFQNKSTADMYFNDLGGTASGTANNSTYLPADAYYESEPGGASVTAISVFCAMTGAQFVAKEW